MLQNNFYNILEEKIPESFKIRKKYNFNLCFYNLLCMPIKQEEEEHRVTDYRLCAHVVSKQIMIHNDLGSGRGALTLGFTCIQANGSLPPPMQCLTLLLPYLYVQNKRQEKYLSTLLDKMIQK